MPLFRLKWEFTPYFVHCFGQKHLKLFLNSIKLHNSVTPWEWIWNISQLIGFLALNAKIMKFFLPFLSIFHAKWLLVPTKKITSLILYIACWMYFSHWRKMQTKNTIKRWQLITDVSKEGSFYCK